MSNEKKESDKTVLEQNELWNYDEMELCPNSAMFLLEYIWIVSNKIANRCSPEEVEKRLLDCINYGHTINGCFSDKNVATAVQKIVNDPFTIFHEIVAQQTIANRINILLNLPLVDAGNIELFARNLGILEGYDITNFFENLSFPSHISGYNRKQ